MYLIVGLGNPGTQYQSTRHNIGFMVLDCLAARLKSSFIPARGEYWKAEAVIGDNLVLLMKPSTYMNNSGTAVLEAAGTFNVPPEQILVVYDDFHLPLGSLRIRPAGSDGGHHGMESIIYHLQTDQVPRLRCGIGQEEKPSGRDAIVDFVLARFYDREESAVKRLLDRAADAATEFVTGGIDSAMNKFNTAQLL